MTFDNKFRGKKGKKKEKEKKGDLCWRTVIKRYSTERRAKKDG